VLDGELISLGDDGLPSFPRLSNRILHGHEGFAVTYVIFDVLAHDGESTMALPYSERRRILESLALHGPAWCTAEVFEDGGSIGATPSRGSFRAGVGPAAINELAAWPRRVAQ